MAKPSRALNTPFWPCSEYSKTLNEMRIKVLGAREFAIQEIVTEAKIKLRDVAKNPVVYKKLLTDLLVQVRVTSVAGAGACRRGPCWASWSCQWLLITGGAAALGYWVSLSAGRSEGCEDAGRGVRHAGWASGARCCRRRCSCRWISMASLCTAPGCMERHSIQAQGTMLNPGTSPGAALRHKGACSTQAQGKVQPTRTRQGAAPRHRGRCSTLVQGKVPHTGTREGAASRYGGRCSMRLQGELWAHRAARVMIDRTEGTQGKVLRLAAGRRVQGVGVGLDGWVGGWWVTRLQNICQQTT